jgi:hypothetical protein
MNTNLAIVLFVPVLVALNPALLVAVFVMILLPDAKRLMLSYLAGAYAISIAVALVILFSLHGSGFAIISGHILGPGAYIAAGATALVVAFMLAVRLDGPLQKWHTRRKAAKGSKKQAKQPWSQRMLGNGSTAVTFVVGATMSFPGPLFLNALHHIAELNLRIVPTFLLIIYLCFMQQLFLELTLLADLFAPGRTQAVVVRIRTWLACHGRQIAARGRAGVGIVLSVSGLVPIS